MSTITWLGEPDGYLPRHRAEEITPTEIAGYRRAEHTDLPRLKRLMGPAAREIFGDVELGRIYETSCLPVVQYNERHDVVSGIFLCNYPNVPSVPPYDWLTWLKTIYGIPNVTERNTMFVHSLVWDERYMDRFLKDLLAALFDNTTYCQHVILVMPPQVTPADVFEREMTRILPAKGAARDTDAMQSLYLAVRHQSRRKLKIRRVVEEDNDEVMMIIESETTRLRELYGEYYISEMIRYPDRCRRLIIGEDADGLAAGAMSLNSTIDVDLLNENFELTPYNGLRKTHESDEAPRDVVGATSELLGPLFAPRSHEYTRQSRQERRLQKDDASFRTPDALEDKRCSGETGSDEESGRDSSVHAPTTVTDAPMRVSFQDEVSGAQSKRDGVQTYMDRTRSIDGRTSSPSCGSRGTLYEPRSEQLARSRISSPDVSYRFASLDDLSSVSHHHGAYRQSKTRTTVFADVTFGLPRRSTLPAVKDNETRLIHDVLSHPTYHGETNVFVIEIFAMRREMRPHWSHDFLEAAFDCFPDLEYCAILLPFSHPYYLFLRHFARVPLRCDKDFPTMLYVVHRAVFFGELRCRRAEAQDRKAVEELLSVVPTKHETLADFELAMDPLQLDLDCIVFECNDTMLGLAILCAEKQIDLIRSRYHIEDHASMQSITQDDCGRLLHFVLTPIFSAYHRFFFREIARLSELTVIFYRLHHEDESALTRKRSLVSCLSDMIPVNPRGPAGYRFPNISDNIDKRGSNAIDKKDDGTFSLFVTSPRMATVPRVIIDMKIVVVGASDCGVAFAEYLALRSTQRYTQFTNVTLISPHGLPFDNERDRAGRCLLPFRGRFCREYRRCVAARAWINIVYGTVIAINRKKKYVTVMNQGNLTYDYLILTCGLQYQRPILQEEMKARKRGIIVENQTPWNCLTVNDDTEASVCLEKIRTLTGDLKETKAILFYGRNIDCYCALRALIEYGVEPSWITLIEPSLNRCETHDNIFFYDREVDQTITNAILRDGVRVLSGWDMIDWALTENEDGGLMIESVSVEKKDETGTLVCDALFNFHERAIDLSAFLAFCRAGLVFDGLLVIDPECRTNDPFIFAAGTVTKYSRRFYAESWQHKHYSSAEIGERLAQILRKVIDVQRWNEEVPVLPKNEKMYLTLPVFRASIVIACVLPGDYYYLHVRKPGKKISRQRAISQRFYGEVLVTGTCASDIGYFRIRLNPYDSVETVTCVSKKIFEVQNMVALYGKHESMLNELKSRFRNSLVADFYAYFREHWCAAILYDRFECLRVENRATLLSQTAVHGDSLVDDCVRALIKSKWEAMSGKDRRYIESRYAGSIYHRELESNLVNFLEFYENDLPVYCVPHKHRQMYTDTEESPLYFEQ